VVIEMLTEYEFAASPFGDILIARTSAGICHLSFVDQNRDEALRVLAALNPGTLRGPGVRKKPTDLVALAESIFEWPITTCLPLNPGGTDFQCEVWQVLMDIPFATTVSYQDVAERIGRPSAVRAVASAIAANRIAWLIPCHRVIRSDGGLGGYRWGIDRKSDLLQWECSRLLQGGEEAVRTGASSA
jgi:AraC family transcriptional regulator of adaptative response/methylated-DNA-[protein]-cysteine methyltransferase